MATIRTLSCIILMMTTPNVTKTDHLIQENVKRHERIASQYDKRHAEIYNQIEQDRLHEALARALSLIRNPSQHLLALDFGCGAGNLTRHLLDLGVHVMAADVTPSFVSMVRSLDPVRVQGHDLNGRDLNGLHDGTFDLVATYSVLHHVPDYLAAVRELARVTRSGGIVFIDHESAAAQWSPTDTLREYWRAAKPRRTLSWYTSRVFDPGWLYTRWKQLFDPRYAPEGDIHVWPDDHVEWSLVEQTLVEAGCEIIDSTDYLLYQPHVPIDVYRAFEHRCADMHCCIARKR